MDDTQIRAIEEKLKNLLARYRRLQKENETLKQELHIAKKDLALNNNVIADLQQKLDVQSLGVQNWSEEQKQQLNKRIDLYLKEIENSLALLTA